MKKKNRLQMLAALLAATLSIALTSPIAVKADEDYNVEKKEEATVGSGRIYYLKNSHGDVIGQMDENGNLLTSYAYNAFGEQVSTVAIFGEQKGTTNRFLYAGEQYDATSGLYYLRARHYDVRAGRFTQEDTYLGDGRNLYAYVHSNPLKYVDPTGHTSVEIFDPDGNPLDDWQDKSMDGGGVNVNSSSGLNFTGTTALHMQNSGRYVPVQILQDGINYGVASPDPQGTSAIMYNSTMYKNGTAYNLEVLYDGDTNTIYHFMYYR